MMCRELIRMVGSNIRRLLPNLDFEPGRGRGRSVDGLRVSSWHDGAVGLDSERRPDVRALRARRKQQGALADDVGIALYLGTRGVRGL